MPFAVDISFQDKIVAAQLPIKQKKLEQLVRKAFAQMRKTDEFKAALELLETEPKSLAVFFCNDESMRATQLQFRRLDRTTDILSFPTLELPGHLRKAAARNLGDLVVSLPAVARGAKRGRRTVQLELLDVLIHGILHLLGLDHVKGGPRARRMRKIQKHIYLRLKTEISG